MSELRLVPDPEARIVSMIKRLEAQCERISARYLDAVERVADATDHGALQAALEALESVSRHSHTVGQVLQYHQFQLKARAEAKQKESQLS